MSGTVKNWEEARKHFLSVQSHTPKSAKAPEADVELARLARAQEKWPQAFQLMNKLERRYRGNTEYPGRFYLISLKFPGALKKHADQCRFAVKLYSRYPTYALSKGWGADFFPGLKVRDALINCQLNSKDRDKRLATLLLAGEFDEVQAELKTWLAILKGDKHAKPEDFGNVEIDTGQLALSEGKVKEAITHFQGAQDLMGHNFTAQMLFGPGLLVDGRLWTGGRGLFESLWN